MASKKRGTLGSRIKKNPWILATFVLAIFTILVSSVLIFEDVSSTKAGNNLVDFINSQGGSQIELISAKNFGNNLYEVTVSLEGEEMSIYTTKDGTYGIDPRALIPLEVEEEVQTNPTNTGEIAKSDRPKAELFIWSYCPYGVTAQTPFSEVASLLEGSADFDVVLYYAGHGDYELQQNKIQACIQNLDKEKYWDYATSFVEDIYPVCGDSRDIACDLEESVSLMKALGIDSDAVLSCVENQGEALVEADYERAKELGVTGSPTLVLNDRIVSAARNSAAYLEATCSAFSVAPEACGTQLSGEGSVATGNC